MTDPTDHVMTPTHSVRYSYSVGIRVKVLGPTNTHGTRLKVFRSDSTYADDPDRITVHWEYALSGSDNGVAAVNAYLAGKMATEHGDSWRGSWVMASASPNEWVAVKARGF